MITLTHEQLASFLEYDPRTGEFKWLKDVYRVRKGDRAGSLGKNGYWYITVCQETASAHRTAWFLMTGEWPTKDIDHINHQRADNRWCNLREATASQNMANRGVYSNSKSGVKGVIWTGRKSPWRAQVRKDGRNIIIGNYCTLAEASEAYKQAAKLHHGEFSHV